MTVRRTLPQRSRSLIGAWCFVDHYGPDEVERTGGMLVPPHPHSGLQTVSWLFSGEIEHRDSSGAHAVVRPGVVNLMTAGSGICHSEVSTPQTRVLHGVQLWIALPDSARDVGRSFERHETEAVDLGGAQLRVLLGTVGGVTSPVRTFSPVLGAELVLSPGARLTLYVDEAHEHGLLVDQGQVALAGVPVAPGRIGYVGTGVSQLVVEDVGGAGARMLLLGGEPLDEQIVMWWNFVGRTHDEIAAMRLAWQSGSARYGSVEGYVGDPVRLPAPELPHVTLRPRVNPPTANPG
ncbi:MAG: pirin family protein [Frankiales bacterium]|nr:pirin family protein [Frankiales bacterium]